MKNVFIAIFLLMSISSCSVFSGGSCGSYGDWQFQENECKVALFCPLKRFKATYKVSYADKECKTGKVRKYKKEKIKCGC